MTKPILKTFRAVAPMFVQKYERYLPTAFDESMTLLEKMNKIIVYLNQVGELTNDVVTQWNDVAEWTANDGVNEVVQQRLDVLVFDGTLGKIINETLFNEKADKTELQNGLNQLDELKADKESVNNEINQVNNEINQINEAKANKEELAPKANKTLLPYVHVEDVGIFSDTGQDVHSKLQNFINENAGRKIQLSSGVYLISKPLLIPMNTQLIGESGFWNDTSTSTTIKRINHDPDTKHQVDAVIILDYPSGTYFRNGKLLNLNLEGESNDFRTTYGIYAPQCAFLEIKDVHVRYTKNVFYTNNTWQSYLSLSGRYSDNGLVFKSPNQILTGTSIVFEKCFMSYMSGIAYDVYGLTYSTFNSCAADFIDGIAYKFERSKGITLNSCGAEFTSDVFDSWASTVTVNSMMTLGTKGKTSGGNTAYIKSRSTGRTTFVNCDFASMVDAGVSYDIICDGGAVITFINSPRPTGGNPWVSYNNNSKIVEIGINGLTVSPQV